MRVDTISTFPGMFDSIMGESIMKRAQEKGLLDFHAHDLRDWTYDRHRTTDDYPYGGGSGLVMKCEPIFEALEAVLEVEPESLPNEDCSFDNDVAVIFLAPQGRRFDDAFACELSRKSRMVFVCGHYEGIDERAYSLATHVISLGDYVLTSGELASMVVIDAVIRKIPGVLGADDGALNESFAEGLLEYPQYTRPSIFRGMSVPEVLLSGHHANIDKWRRAKSLESTLRIRPDLIASLLDNDKLGEKDISYIESLLNEEKGVSSDIIS